MSSLPYHIKKKLIHRKRVLSGGRMRDILSVQGIHVYKHMRKGHHHHRGIMMPVHGGNILGDILGAVGLGMHHKGGNILGDVLGAVGLGMKHPSQDSVGMGLKGRVQSNPKAFVHLSTPGSSRLPVFGAGVPAISIRDKIISSLRHRRK